jgi:hypothetical protein
MGKVNDVVSNLVQMLETDLKETESRVEIMHDMQTYLVEESKTVVRDSLDRLMSRINADVAEITSGTAVVVVSPEGRVTVKETRTDREIDHYLIRLKSQHFKVLTLSEFTHIIESVKDQVAKGNLMLVIRFLGANARPRPTRVYSPGPILKTSLSGEAPSLPIVKESLPREPASPQRNLSDFLSHSSRARACTEESSRINHTKLMGKAQPKRPSE